MTDPQASSALDRLEVVRDAMTVSKVFGESYQLDGGITVIPVAKVLGGGGGGGGTGTNGSDGAASGSGAGMGFGTAVRPVGVVIVQDGKVSWQPTVDVTRMILGAQLLGLAAILTLRRIARRR